MSPHFIFTPVSPLKKIKKMRASIIDWDLNNKNRNLKYYIRPAGREKIESRWWWPFWSCKLDFQKKYKWCEYPLKIIIVLTLDEINQSERIQLLSIAGVPNKRSSSSFRDITHFFFSAFLEQNERSEPTIVAHLVLYKWKYYATEE